MANNSLETIKRQVDFSRVYTDGTRFKICRWLSVSCLLKDSSELPSCRFGFVISKKVGSAVVRNRLRRWSKESLRRLLPELQPADYVIVFYSLPNNEINLLNYDKIFKQLSKVSHLEFQRSKYSKSKTVAKFTAKI